MSSNGHVQIADFSDREIMLMIHDLGGEVTSPELAARIYGWRIEFEDKDAITHGIRCVSSRLAWMRRYGLVESWIEVETKKRTWKVSIPGKSMVGFELSRPAEAALARITDTGGLVLANRIGEKLVKAGEITGTAMRRELQFAITRRKRR